MRFWRLVHADAMTWNLADTVQLCLYFRSTIAVTSRAENALFENLYACVKICV